MTAFLPDVNVLIALIDPSHVHHERAHAWFHPRSSDDWITVPMTENGVLRIVSHPSYSNTQPTPVVTASLRSLCAVEGHRFAPDSVSLLDDNFGQILSSSQVTDTYLAGLSLSLGARLATFDRKIVTTALVDAHDVVHLIP